MRQLDLDLEAQTGLSLGDFDVLAQLGLAGGELRMTELAHRALISRSGMTRRVSRLADAGLVHRAGADADARAVVVSLTDVGVERLLAVAPVHLRDVYERFVRQLDHDELAVLERAFDKVTLDCSFGSIAPSDPIDAAEVDEHDDADGHDDPRPPARSPGVPAGRARKRPRSCRRSRPQRRLRPGPP